MNANNDDFKQRRIEELEAEVARLKSSLEYVTKDRKELRDQLYSVVEHESTVTDEEMIERLRNHVPGSGRKWLEENGFWPKGLK